jgi:pimeloyl-ACP methyl ester carboxylesterase
MNRDDVIAGIVEKYFGIIKVPHSEPAKEFLSRCQSYSVKIDNGIYKYYQRGSGPTVVLVHGLHSNLGSMVAIADDLVEEGFKVVLFDAPAHGEAIGTTTDPVQVRDVIREIGNRIGEMHAVICHSLGGLWALSALSGDFRAKTLISIASPSSKKFLVEKFVQLHRIDGEIVGILVEEIENRLGANVWREFSPSEIVKTIGIPGLIIHGKNDDFVPPNHAEQLQANWAEAKVEMIDGAGHFDIVGSHKVRQLITAYLRELH